MGYMTTAVRLRSREDFYPWVRFMAGFLTLILMVSITFLLNQLSSLAKTLQALPHVTIIVNDFVAIRALMLSLQH